ncbi:hypothetical protein K438DRAFT_1772184 [Mycena galopus ATCC 62051]|nr:hypothetical protein K438DRAFT_1772184 [Mycena galopus ATCC 62051]
MPTNHLDAEISQTEHHDTISRIRDPIEQHDALLDSVLLGLPVYQEKDGEVYGVYRIRYDGGNTIFDPKMGRAVDTTKRQGDYQRKCAPVEFIWVVKYRCACPKTIGVSQTSLEKKGPQNPKSSWPSQEPERIGQTGAAEGPKIQNQAGPVSHFVDVSTRG